jgi:nitrogen-specific signal transduction histidine kinase
MGETHSELHDTNAISHGICNSCLTSLFNDKNIDFIPFLNSLSAPVVLIDENNTYLSANKSALSLLDKDHIELKNKRTGDIFTCENAKLTGGCGYTEKCGGCQMLQLVNDTYDGRDNFNNVPVTLMRKQDAVREELNLHISTEKVNGLVLMRIDQFKEKSLPHS